jgi:hypothetical protein
MAQSDGEEAMRVLVLAAALIAAPGANAQSVCDAIQHAARVGATDVRFATFRRAMPASPQGFDCRINLKGSLAAYACSMPVEPGTAPARSKALIEDVRACVAPSVIVEQTPKPSNAVFMISRSPNSWVVVNGADDPTRVYMNVVVAWPRPARSSSDSSSQAPVTTPDPWQPAYDPGIEKPHYPTPGQ